ncbi:MAG TPA: outer membrane beta-barrel protein [Chthoniobacterales bacterium]
MGSAIGGLTLTLARAQEEEELPEQPTWTAPAAPGVRAEDSSIAEDGSTTTATPTPEPTPPPKPLPPFILEPDESTLGVPVDQGWNLPDFSDTSSWFQMQGLRMRVGPLQLRFDLDLNVGYNDNIFGTNFPKVGDYVSTISPTIEAGIGEYPRPRQLVPLSEQQNYFYLRYTPSFLFFAENPAQNATNENLTIAGRYTFRRLVLDGAFSYVTTTNPTPTDIGRQQYNTTSLNIKASYALSTKTFLQVIAAGSYQDYPEIPNTATTTVSIAPALGYQFSKKLRLTLGPTAGVSYFESGGEQPFQSVNLGFTYDTTHKLQFEGSVGIQRTEGNSNSSDDGDFTSPVFSLGATYTIDNTSSIALDLARNVSTGGTSNGETYIQTAISASYQKRIWSRIQLDLTGSYQVYDYQGVGARTDTYIVFNVRVGYLFWQQRCSVYVTYVRNQRISDISAYEYDSNFLGTGINVQF